MKSIITIVILSSLFCFNCHAVEFIPQKIICSHENIENSFFTYGVVLDSSLHYSCVIDWQDYVFFEYPGICTYVGSDGNVVIPTFLQNFL